MWAISSGLWAVGWEKSSKIEVEVEIEIEIEIVKYFTSKT